MNTANNFHLPVPTKGDSETLSQAINSSDSTFKLLYFNIQARGHILRLILTLSGAEWEEINAVGHICRSFAIQVYLKASYLQKKNITPPTNACLSDYLRRSHNLELAESLAIERYLAKKFNILGKNEYESHIVDQFCTSTESTNIQLTQKVHLPPREIQWTDEERILEANNFYRDTLGKFITLHEAHLQKNGSNGHYVGDNFTLADLKTTVFMERVLSLTPKGVNEVSFSEERSPNL
ncbi:hypothetical protein BGX26_000781 [Mortierella sp. AD094]|nr:hypothetical protein BGX26_000781 [Mortierella sp. AD094]